MRFEVEPSLCGGTPEEACDRLYEVAYGSV
jgi:hypothetical protein